MVEVRIPNASSGPALDRRAIVPLVILAFTQDTIYALVFLSFMNRYLLGVLQTTPGIPAYTLALYGATRLVIHPLAGKLIDLTSPRLVLRLSVGSELLGVVLLLGIHTLPAFLVASVLLAAGSASIWPLIYESLARTQAAEAHSKATGVLAIVGYVGTGVGFLSGVLMGRLVHRRAPFFFTGALVVLAGATQGSRVFDRAGLVAPPPENAAAAAEAAAAEAPPAKSAGPRAALIFFALIMFLDFAAVSALAGAYGPYTRLSLGISLLRTTFLLMPAGVAAAVSLYVISRYSKPSRRLREMAILYLLAGAGALGLAAAPGPAVALFTAIVLGAGLGGIGPIVAATVVQLGGVSNRGSVVGTLLAVEGLGSVAGPGAVGIANDFLSPRAGMALIGGLFLVLMAVAAYGLHQPRIVNLPAVPQS